jgi:hypothetical protein
MKQLNSEHSNDEYGWHNILIVLAGSFGVGVAKNVAVDVDADGDYVVDGC